MCYLKRPHSPVLPIVVLTADHGDVVPPPLPQHTDTLLKYEKDNKVVRGHLLNHMSNSLSDLSIDRSSVNEIWEELQEKYEGDDKPLMQQLHKYENLADVVVAEGMKMCEVLKANLLLEKLPPFCNEYRNSIKHKKHDLTLKKPIDHMRTKEANCLKHKASNSVNYASVKKLRTMGLIPTLSHKDDAKYEILPPSHLLLA